MDWLEHFASLDEGEWQPMLDLKGIDGKAGVRVKRSDGTFMGADFIRMQPGSRFPLHSHEGDHEIYFIQGTGYVMMHEYANILLVGPGDLVHIPGKFPHAIGVSHRCSQALIFVAFGHPHHVLSSTRRMKVIDEAAGAK